ncbi:hypothetical protein NPX13_g145 [Xylaria arbuscula]|uniref:Uncharacterized protein n=1 Tax=Xylaria arbuscula TaxID=114810 RepID=A0A9W8NPC4_9PEZI|nr:hypothetical protein NPX13_g145 [Xylaria arbuscula]
MSQRNPYIEIHREVFINQRGEEVDRFIRTTTRLPRQEYDKHDLDSRRSYVSTDHVSSYPPPYQYSYPQPAFPADPYYEYNERRAPSYRVYEAPYPPEPRGPYTNSRWEQPDRQYRSHPRYEYLAEDAPAPRSPRVARSNGDRGRHETSSRSHASGSKKDKHKRHESSAKTHTSRSHKNDRGHKTSSKSHSSHSHKKEQQSYESPIIEEYFSESEDAFEPEGSHRAAEREASKPKSSNINKSKPRYVPNPSLPFKIQRALATGKNSIEFLEGTINVVLLYEWCFTGRELHTHPGTFKPGFEVIPVERDNHGQLKPIEDESNE